MEIDIDKPYVIGLDMGGTNSVFGIVDQRGNIKSQTVISTKAYPDFKDYVKAAYEALQPALDQVGGKEAKDFDYMINDDKTVNTAHSLNLVPFIVVDDAYKGQPKSGKLGDVAPTILKIMGIGIPAEMTGNILI